MNICHHELQLQYLLYDAIMIMELFERSWCKTSLLVYQIDVGLASSF